MRSITRLYTEVLGSILFISGIPGLFPQFPLFKPVVDFLELNTLHSLVHLFVGALGVVAGLLLSERSIRVYAVAVAALYGALALVGFINASVLSVFHIVQTDNYLHIALFVVSLILCVASFLEYRAMGRMEDLAAGLGLTHDTGPRPLWRPDVWLGQQGPRADTRPIAAIRAQVPQPEAPPPQRMSPGAQVDERLREPAQGYRES